MKCLFLKSVCLFFVIRTFSILIKSMELFAILKLIYTFATAFRDVAQPGRVRVWGACGRRFKSCHPDYLEEVRS